MPNTLSQKKENGIFSILAHDLVLKPYVYMLYCDLFSYFVKQSISLAQFAFLKYNLKSLYENVSGNLLGHITHRTPIHLNQPSKQVCTKYTNSTTFGYKSFSAVRNVRVVQITKKVCAPWGSLRSGLLLVCTCFFSIVHFCFIYLLHSINY